MNQIQKQINRAQRRMLVSHFVKALCICLCVGLTIAAIGIAIPKIWHLSFLNNESATSTWLWSWISGGVLFGIVSSGIWSYSSKATQHDAAIEVDRRFKLKERLSSALSLSNNQLESEAGQALVNDAIDRAETIDVGEQFQFQPSRQMLLPILPAILLLGLIFVPDAVAKEVPEAKPEKQNTEIKTAIEEARKKIKKKIEEMEAKGLKDASKDLKSLQKKIDNLSSGLKNDKKDTLIKLNNVKKQIEDRKGQLGGESKELKKQLNQLKKINDGPAKKISQAINEGDFKEATNAIKDLVKDLRAGKLSDKEKRKLAKDLNEIANELKKLAEKHEQDKQDLKDQIKKANQAGDLEKAAQLQQKLEKKQQQDKQMQKMKKMAQNMQKCAECMKQGNGQPKQSQPGQQQAGQQGNQPSDAEMKEAMESLEDLQDMMEEMQDEMDQLEDLEDIMKDLEQAKNDCNGCEGGQKGDKPNWQDWGKGSGAGGGKRDKQETETGTYKSRVKGKIQRGETVVTGNADGNNISGRSISEAREIAKSSMNEKSDPLENQKLPRSQRDHAREYFESLRGN